MKVILKLSLPLRKESAVLANKLTCKMTDLLIRPIKYKSSQEFGKQKMNLNMHRLKVRNAFKILVACAAVA